MVSVLLLQPFGLESPGGAGRLFRTLCADGPAEILSVCASPSPPPPTRVVEEVYFGVRPRLARVRSTRLGVLVRQLDDFGHRGLERELEILVNRHGVEAIHALADAQIAFAIGHRVARNTGARFVLSLHDAPWYKRLRWQVGNERFFAALCDAWCDADACIVISPEMGEAVSQRYGRRPFLVVTDGLEAAATSPAVGVPREFTIYFCGSVHVAHHENFDALVKAVAQIRRQGAWMPRIVLRTGTIRGADRIGFIEERPWGATDAEVTAEAASADVLYLPLPFGERYAAFSELSLPTKLVTYLGSGRPILFHGPSSTATGRLLGKFRAGQLLDDCDPAHLATEIVRWLESDRPAMDAAAALSLARARFMKEQQRDVFWGAVLGHTASSEQTA